MPYPTPYQFPSQRHQNNNSKQEKRRPSKRQPLANVESAKIWITIISKSRTMIHTRPRPTQLDASINFCWFGFSDPPPVSQPPETRKETTVEAPTPSEEELIKWVVDDKTSIFWKNNRFQRMALATLLRPHERTQGPLHRYIKWVRAPNL